MDHGSGIWLHVSALTSFLFFYTNSLTSLRQTHIPSNLTTYLHILYRTPIGQAIGLATHTLYSPNSEIGLIVVGVMNAVSAGLLTFASLVELLSEDFLSDESWRYLRGKQRVIACFLVFGGAFFMSLVGAWA